MPALGAPALLVAHLDALLVVPPLPWPQPPDRCLRAPAATRDPSGRRRGLEFGARGPVLRPASHRANPRRGLAGPAVVTHFDNRINEVHITCLSTNSSCYWRWRWWPSPAGSDWPTCCSGAGRAMGVLSWSSRLSRPW